MHINRFHLCCPHIVWPQKWHFVKVNLFVISVIYSTVSIKRDETTHNTLWSETSQDFNRPICKGPSEASRVCLYSIHYSIILTEHNVAYKEMWEGKKPASFSADQYQHSRSRTGTDIDTLCGADLSHSPQVIPSSCEEVTGPATKKAIRRWFQVLNTVKKNPQLIILSSISATMIKQHQTQVCALDWHIIQVCEAERSLTKLRCIKEL